MALICTTSANVASVTIRVSLVTVELVFYLAPTPTNPTGGTNGGGLAQLTAQQCYLHKHSEDIEESTASVVFNTLSLG